MSNNPVAPQDTAGTPSSAPTPTPVTTPTPNVSSSKKSLGIQHGGSNNASFSPAPGSSNAPTLSNSPAPVDFEALVARLLDPNVDIKLKVHLITELREMIDLCSRDVEFTKHLDVMISAVVEILSSTRPVFITSTWDYKYRLLLLDILSRVSAHEAMKIHALKVMNLLIDIIRHDNEESVIICFKLVVDLYRASKAFLESTVAPFFQTIMEMYGLVPATVEEIFGDITTDKNQPDGIPISPDGATHLNPDPSKAVPDSGKGNLMRRTASGNPNVSGNVPLTGSDSTSCEAIRGMKSFRALQECPVAVVFLLQTYKATVVPSLPACLPLIFKFLKTSAPPQVMWHGIIAERGQAPFVGVAPTITKAGKRSQHTELMIAQVKVMSFIAYVIRAQSPLVQPFAAEIPQVIIRILKDIPPESSLSRRELVVALRHILGTEYRSLFIPFLNDLLTIRIFLGTGITSFESLRHLVYSTHADLIQNIKPELQGSHIKAVLVNFAELLNDPTSTTATQAMAGKVIYSLVDLVGPNRLETHEAIRLSRWLMESFVRKIEALADFRAYQIRHQADTQEKLSSLNRLKDDGIKYKGKGKEVNAPSTSDAQSRPCTESGRLVQPDASLEEDEDILIERGKILGGICAVLEPPPDQFKDHTFGRRVIVRSCITSFQILFGNLKKMDAPLPNAMLLGRLLTAAVRCFGIYEHRREVREMKEVVDCFVSMFTQADLVLFSETFEPCMPLLMKELRSNSDLLAFPQYFLASPILCKATIGITLRHIMKQLHELGQDKQSGVIVKLLKMCFLAVNMFPDVEATLQPHLSRLIMDSLRFASFSNEPGQYYSVLRALFRAIGGGRFEILYKEILPLIQVLLEELNVLLNSTTDNKERELFAELCLTVPVRLSVLLPYLTYLMRPLVIALQAIPDLVSQGLRTLELCVDNLTQEFFTPLMAPVVHDVMTSLWKLLKPLPYNPQHAPVALRILGKLGGRNRRVLRPKAIEWKQVDTQGCYLPIKLDGQRKSLTLPPLVQLAARLMRRGDIHYRRNGFAFLKNTTPIFLSMGYGYGEREETFAILLKGLFDATRVPEFSSDAEAHLSSLFEHVFITEIWQDPGLNPDQTCYSLSLTNTIIDALIENLTVATDQHHLQAASQFTQRVFKKLFQRAKTSPLPKEEMWTLAQRTLCTKASSSCYNHSWPRKCAGHQVLSVLVNDTEMSASWIVDYELEIIRALLFLHKDAPSATEKILEGPTDTFLKLLKICHNPSDVPIPSEMAGKLNYIVGLLIIELCSQTSGVRRVAQLALQLISERTLKPMHELLMPARERLSPIFGKPLRALAFPMQIGHLDALTFCVRLEPPLFDYSDQLMRILQEALGIADADDVALIGRTNQVKTAKALIELRVVCLRFLAATLRLPEMRQQSATKAKILSVYFQSLYAKNVEVVDAAHASLKELLANGGNRLPKDLLQSGLRPVLNNLSDHKKLTLPSLQGLARLVELLTNYFKVEIGSKLLDHFRQLSDPQTLATAALSSSQESGVLEIMAGVVNIFHLLAAPAAGVYLRDMIAYVVHVETILKKVTASPFTKPLSLYIDIYPEAAATYFLQRLDDERCLNTLKWVLLSDHSKNFRDFFKRGAMVWLQQSYTAGATKGLHGTVVLQQLVTKDPESIATNTEIVHALSQRWVSEGRKARLALGISDDRFAQLREDVIAVEIMMTCIKTHPFGNIDLLFHLADVLEADRIIEYSHIIRFYNEQVLKSPNVTYKAAILTRFLDIINNDDVRPQQKMSILRHLINPLLLVAFERGEKENDIVDAEYINKVYLVIWSAFIPNTNVKTFTTNDKLDVELLHMASLIVEYRHALVADQRKEIIKFGWYFLSLRDDQTVKNAAYILISRFIAVYDSPTKIVSQILNALLKLHTSEAKHLAQKALDILLPVVPKRYKDNPSEWIRLTKRTLSEEGQNMSFLCSFYAAVVRNPEPFYTHRDIFIPHISAALPKLIVSGSSNHEARILVVDLIELVTRWEQQRIGGTNKDETNQDAESASRAHSPELEQSPAKRIKLDQSSTPAPSAGGSEMILAGYNVPYPIRDAIVSILIRLITISTEPASKNSLLTRALSLMKLILTKVWPEVEVKVNFFQRALSAEITEGNLGIVCNTAEVLNVVLANKSDEWLLNDLCLVQTLVEKSVISKYEDLLKIQRPLLNRLFRVLPAEDPTNPGQDEDPDKMKLTTARLSTAAFELWANSTIKEGLKESRTHENLCSALILLQAYDQAQPSKVDVFIHDIVRNFTRALREHLPAAQADPNHPKVEQTRFLIEGLCDLMKTRVTSMGEDRLFFLTGLVQLVEKSPNVGLCHYILGVQRKWVEDKDALPTSKEKATMLVKMMSCELKGDEDLLNEYLKLILDIYESSSYSRSEFTVRLEPAFLLGCRSRDPEIRTKFMAVFDDNIRPEPFARLQYLIGVQNWEPLADINWIHHALDIFLGSIDMNDPVLIEGRLPYPLSDSSDFLNWAESVKMSHVINSARQLLYADPAETEKVWISLFQAAWSTFSKREQADLTRYLIHLFSKEYLMKAIDRRPNVVQIILSGIRGCNPTVVLPPHLVRYLGKTYAAWYTAIENLQEVLDEVVDFNQDAQNNSQGEHRHHFENSREVAGEALAQLYAELGETDIFHGQWRRKSLCMETNAAMSYEQIGEWEAAEQVYEMAQEKARANLLPFGQGEYNLWEDHWVLCASKMQQWELLSDLARAEHNSELLLECQWRQADWSAEHESIKLAIANLPSQSIRKTTFQAYLTLLNGHMGLLVDEHRSEFTKICDEGIQLCLHQWFRLPEIVTESHIPLLQAFQQFVELQEASQIFHSLTTTTSQNLEARSADLKHVLQTWRERLPNPWDDINIWSDLVAWRQHVFSAINRTYIPLIQSNVVANTQSFAYRGHHETAWMVNRFAHVARKHGLLQLCKDSLTRIYTLPNIEISEAFLKLCEQAKVHFEHSEDFGSGFEAISHTNLMYFGASQKAEFHTIKAMFLARLNLHEEASQVFNQAVSTDFQYPKAWAQWGAYQDKLFENSPENLQLAAGAVNCYLQASGLYKNGKSRKLLIRILWLIGLDDANGTIGRAFDNYKGDISIWHWTYFIPQLLSCLSAPREARYAKALLTKIAKSFPQSLFFYLRTTGEELLPQRQRAYNTGYRSAGTVFNNSTNPETNSSQNPSTPAQQDGTSNSGINTGQVVSALSNHAPQSTSPPAPLPFEHVDDIMGTLKTQFPLLALSMEMLVDQLLQRFKPPPEEDVYRLLCALLQEALASYIQRAGNPNDDLHLSDALKSKLAKFSENLGKMPMQPHFHRDFVESSLNLRSYVNKLQEWRLKYEQNIERKLRKSNLENASHWMIEFQYQKFDDVEIPGQYLKRFNDDNNAHFVRLVRFSTVYGYHRQKEHWFRRITMIGHDASQHSFVIQLPVPRSSRREERIMQLFRMLNCTLARRRESRTKDASFTIPAVIPFATNIRIMESNVAHCSLQEIFESYCQEAGISRDDPFIAYAERLRTFGFESVEDVDLITTKLEIGDEITTKLIPDTILKNFFYKSMRTAGDLWYFRKRMTIQYASFIFVSYIFSLSLRYPHRITFDRSSGAVFTTDMFPSVSPNKPEFGHTEAVPFRFTPNIQQFLTRQNIEGLLTSTLMAIGKVLVQREGELEHNLSIFIRDEVMSWNIIAQAKMSEDFNTREVISKNIDMVVKRSRLLACEMERKTIDPSNPKPVCQAIIELINIASSLPKLYSMDPPWMPWL
ncbi:hypothetical protein PCANC_13021 [Puccinia coronata f. sp. avenae]|uniref:Non-specific serine/threonine protein kinase n=1 Tax=Puccinia coronata f. sp. avenae TaxID=200324 RepID=A0A2N5USH4_9BASI|nr:hypothetical protein PCANC_13021 [Puccinia coronata f. sp. avenae]